MVLPPLVLSLFFGSLYYAQSIVGDKTIAFLLMDEEMYYGMSSLVDASPTIERGIALHKVCFTTLYFTGFCSLCHRSVFNS